MADISYDPSMFRKYYKRIAPKLKQRRTQAYFMVILSLFAISFFGFFAIRPTVKTIAVLQKQIEDRSYVSQQLEVKINALIAAQEEYRRVEPFLPQIYALLPEKPEITSLLIKLEDQISANQASISAITFDPIVLYGQDPKRAVKAASSSAVPNNVLGLTTATPGMFAFNISFTGAYTDLVDILRRLIQLDRLLTVETADFRLGDTKSATAILTISVRSNSYFLPLDDTSVQR